MDHLPRPGKDRFSPRRRREIVALLSGAALATVSCSPSSSSDLSTVPRHHNHTLSSPESMSSTATAPQDEPTTPAPPSEAVPTPQPKKYAIKPDFIMMPKSTSLQEYIASRTRNQKIGQFVNDACTSLVHQYENGDLNPKIIRRSKPNVFASKKAANGAIFQCVKDSSGSYRWLRINAGDGTTSSLEEAKDGSWKTSITNQYGTSGVGHFKAGVIKNRPTTVNGSVGIDNTVLGLAAAARDAFDPAKGQ